MEEHNTMNAAKKKSIIKCAAIAVSGMAVAWAAGALLGDDFGAFMSWWFTLLVMGVVFLPFTGYLFRRFHDGGWIFSKTIGLAFSGWLMWMLSSAKILKFSRGNCILAVSISMVLCVLFMIFYVMKKHGREGLAETYNFSAEKFASALASELIFLALFLMWVYLRGCKPEAYGTEKFMDYGFMTTMMRSEYMPPQDLWLAGKSINYYYVGQYMATYMTKLSGVFVGDGYNLMMMMLAAMGFSLPYSIMHNVAGTMLDGVRKTGNAVKNVFCKATALLAGTAVAFCGNLHYLVYAVFIPGIRNLFGIETAFEEVGYSFPKYWFPNATRYIGYNPDTTDKTIHEFPLYSFVLGDLHAHVINIIFVMTVVALLLAWLIGRRAAMDRARLLGSFAGSDSSKKKIWGIEDFTAEVFHPAIIAVGFFIGLFHTTNFWDYPIYFVVSGAVILFSNCVIYNFSLTSVKLTALHAAVVLLIAKITALPFTLSFDQISTSIRLTESRTPIYQLLILWGLPIICVIVFLVVQARTLNNKGVFADSGEASKVGRNSVLFRFIGNLEIADLFVLILGLCAIGLVLIPELVYVKDIYTGNYKRANTMFKLTYQAFIMFGMAMAYVITKLLIFGKSKAQRRFAVVAGILLIGSVGYFFNSTKAWYGDYLNTETYKGLDASAFVEKENEQDSRAIAWINENIEGTPVILEVNGDSYTYNERVSVLTGCPTVLGWRTHEWLWRSDGSSNYPPELTERENDVKEIYISYDAQTVLELIDKYDIEYIYVGDQEKEKYEEGVNHMLLMQIGTVVYPAGMTEQEAADTTYIIKVK